MNPYHAANELSCIDFTAYETYFQRDDVKKALNISDNSYKWLACNPHIDMGTTYTPYPDGTISFMPDLVTKIPVVIYNGELDSVIPYLLNDDYVDYIVARLGLSETTPYH